MKLWLWYYVFDCWLLFFSLCRIARFQYSINTNSHNDHDHENLRTEKGLKMLSFKWDTNSSLTCMIKVRVSVGVWTSTQPLFPPLFLTFSLLQCHLNPCVSLSKTKGNPLCVCEIWEAMMAQFVLLVWIIWI